MMGRSSECRHSLKSRLFLVPISKWSGGEGSVKKGWKSYSGQYFMMNLGNMSKHTTVLKAFRFHHDTSLIFIFLPWHPHLMKSAQRRQNRSANPRATNMILRKILKNKKKFDPATLVYIASSSKFDAINMHWEDWNWFWLKITYKHTDL